MKLFKKKSINFSPKEYFFDILDSKIPIQFDNSDDFILKAYYNTPQLFTVVDYIAKVASKNELKFLKPSGKEKKGDPLQEVFANPHPLYSEGEFWESLFKQYLIYRMVLIYEVKGISEVSGLFVLPNNLTKLVPKKNLTPAQILLAKDIKEIVDYIKITYNNKDYRIEVDEVWMITGGTLRFDKEGFLKADSPIEALSLPLQNIQANYEARYSLVENRGRLGVWVNQTANEYGAVPISEKEKDTIYSMFRRRFGLTKGRDFVGITDANLRFESATLPVKDMEFQQSIQGDKIAICDAFQFPLLLLNELTGSTYSNLEKADSLLYTKVIIPLWELIEKSIKRRYYRDSGDSVKFETENIEALQKDKKAQSEIDTAYTNIIISLNASVSSGQMTYENAVNYLVNVLLIEQEIAEIIINSEKKPDNTQQNEQI